MDVTAVGYARVSTRDQSLHSQGNASTGAGASKILTDKITGKKAGRPGRAACLEYLLDDEGDVLLM